MKVKNGRMNKNDSVSPFNPEISKIKSQFDVGVQTKSALQSEVYRYLSHIETNNLGTHIFKVD
jgi:hypothetical protein